MARPPLEEVLKVIGDATPLLEALRVTKINLDNYRDSAQQYAELAKGEKLKIDGIVEQLQAHADAFVALYTQAIATPVEPTE